MEAVLEHLQANYVAYIAVAVCCLPLLYLTRKYSVPTILYTLEIIIYCVIVHVSVNVLVRLTKWFRETSSFKNAFDKQVTEETTWTTPLMEPWVRELYEPSWIFYAEIVACILIIVAVLRYRPMKVHKGRQRKFDDRGKKIGPSARPPAGAKPPAYSSYKK